MEEIVKDVHHYQETSEDGATVTTYWIIEKTSGIYEVLRVEVDESRTLLEPEAGNEVVNRFLDSRIDL